MEELCVPLGSSLCWEICAAAAESAAVAESAAIVQFGITSLPSWGSELRLLYDRRTHFYWNSLKGLPRDFLCLCPKNQKHTKLSSLCMCPYKCIIVFDGFGYDVRCRETVCLLLRNFLWAGVA